MPAVGEIWWVDNTFLGIGPAGGEHPVLVVAGPAIKDGPVQIAHGSSSHHGSDADRILGVFPHNVIPSVCLTSYTRFFISRAQRMARSALKRYGGILDADTLTQLRAIKEQIA